MDKEHKKKVEQQALAGAATEVVDRFGSAVKEHIEAYANKGYFDIKHQGESRKTLIEELKKQGADVRKLRNAKSLKSISEIKNARNDEYRSIKQKAGFAAEVKTTAKANAEHTIRADGRRTVRTDDLEKQIDSHGRSIGGMNDQTFDLVDIDSSGRIIDGTQRQMKFVGKNGTDCARKLLGNRFNKYREQKAPIEIPADFYHEVTAEFERQIAEAKDNIADAKAKGNPKLIKEHEERLQKIKDTKKLVEEGKKLTADNAKVNDGEAQKAAKNPLYSTAKDVVKVAHKAGVQQAKVGAAMSGSISIIKNFVACVKGEIEPKDAAIEVAKDTGKGAAFSYATAFSGAVVKGAMQNASSGYIRTLSKTSLPTQMVSTTLNVGKVMKKYLAGEITGAQCIEQLGEDGFGELGAAMYSTIAVAAVQGVGNTALTIVAGAAGASVGYMAAVAVYQELATSLKEYELAKEERKRIEAECAEAVILIREYREDMIASYEQYFTEHLTDFKNGMDAMDQAITEGDVDGFLASNAQIQSALGHTIQFTSQQEFDDLMLSDEDFKL